MGAFSEVYNVFGFGFLEHLYGTALERELLALLHLGPEASYRLIGGNTKGESVGAVVLDACGPGCIRSSSQAPQAEPLI